MTSYGGGWGGGGVSGHEFVWGGGLLLGMSS